jgi:hypothetical protein
MSTTAIGEHMIISSWMNYTNDNLELLILTGSPYDSCQNFVFSNKTFTCAAWFNNGTTSVGNNIVDMWIQRCTMYVSETMNRIINKRYTAHIEFIVLTGYPSESSPYIMITKEIRDDGSNSYYHFKMVSMNNTPPSKSRWNVFVNKPDICFN